MATKKIFTQVFKIGSILLVGIILGVFLTFFIFSLTRVQDGMFKEFGGPFIFKDVRVAAIEGDDKKDYLGIGKGDYWFIDIGTDEEDKKVKLIGVLDTNEHPIFSAFLGKDSFNEYALYNNNGDIVCRAEREGEQWRKFCLVQKANAANSFAYWYDLDYNGEMDLKTFFDPNENPINRQIYYQGEWINVDKTDFKKSQVRNGNELKVYLFNDNQGWVEEKNSKKAG